MAVINHTEEDVKLLARLMRAEAEGDGKLGMLMVGNVGVNRAVTTCLDFTDIRSIRDMVYQSPGGFEATQFSYFYHTPREADMELARKALKGIRYHPASYSLWFYNPFQPSCPAQFFGQWNVGRYKTHCFYAPVESENCF